MKLSNALISILLPLTAAVPTTLEPRQNLPSTDQIQIQTVTLSGEGCPAGTATSEISLDRTAVTVGFDQFVSELNPASARDRTCAVIIRAQYPIGCITSLVQSTRHGFAELPSGVQGSITGAYAIAPPGRVTAGAATQLTVGGAGWATGQPWQATDAVSTAVAVTANTRDVYFVVNFRSLLTTTGGASFASLRTDDVTLEFTDQRRSPGQC